MKPKIVRNSVLRWPLAVLLIAAAMVACEKEDEAANTGGETPPEAPAPTLTVPSAPVAALASAGTYAINVESNTTWTASVNSAATWCTVSPDTGNGTMTVTVAVAENLTLSARSATVTIAVNAQLSATVGIRQAGVAPSLEISHEIPDEVPVAAGTYNIAVTSNTTWTASVNSAATWCSVSSSNGTVTVTVAKNPAIDARSATVTIAVNAQLSATVGIRQAGVAPPPHAASTLTWIFGSDARIWSDVIHILACDKEDFDVNATTTPSCRSYSENGRKYFYYNFTYVDGNKDNMCPSPWRVPDLNDINAFKDNQYIIDNVATILEAWGASGKISTDATNPPAAATNTGYWSSFYSTEMYPDPVAIYINITNSEAEVRAYYLNMGAPVRCVR
ncbi:MAG: hypothetical protein LBT49_05955 [Prevotellaceae bacterium]|jgi:endonuclease YncB( thermonuclease family)|nr:hypothetical protein [Prevotellaceae bacterium]